MIVIDKIVEHELETIKKNALSESAFDEIANLVEKEDFEQASPLIYQKFHQGYFDVRIMVYYLYGYFLSEGPLSFLSIFDIIKKVHAKYGEYLEEESAKKQFQVSISWLFNQINTKLKHYERLQKAGRTHPFWKKSIDTPIEDLKILIQEVNAFIHFFQLTWPEIDCGEKIAFIAKWVEDIVQSLQGGQEQKPVAHVQKNTEEVQEVDIVVHENPAMEPQVASTFEEIPLSSLPISPPMEELIHKLKVFESLVQKNEFKKSALISADITRLIENFDPCHYFPSLFSTYFSLLAKHIERLKKHWENEDDSQRLFLEKLYHSDIEKFIQWEP